MVCRDDPTAAACVASCQLSLERASRASLSMAVHVAIFRVRSAFPLSSLVEEFVMRMLPWLCPLQNRLALVRRLPSPRVTKPPHDGAAPGGSRVSPLKSWKRA